MARVVCQVLSRPDRVTLIWGDGKAFFEPYQVKDSRLGDFRKCVSRLRQRLADIRPDSDGATGLALARAGHDVYQQLFLLGSMLDGDRTREVRDWLEGLRRGDNVPSVEIVTDAPGLVPWNFVYDRVPDEAAFRSGPASEGWQGFWGICFNLTVGRRVDPLRQLDLLEKPEVLLAVDPGLRGSLSDAQQKRLAEFAQANGLTIVHSNADLKDGFDAREVDFLYVLAPAGAEGVTLGDEQISARALRALVRDGKTGEPANTTVLFLNACQGGSPGSIFESLHAAGLTGFIAPEQPLPADFASAQGLDFLAAFLCQGEPHGKVIQRLHARQPPAGLLYTAVCPSGLRVVRHPEAEEAATPADESDSSEAGEGAEPLPLPESPYRPLAPYDMEDRALFVGRDGDTEDFAEILDAPETRLLVLHGPNGSGKASLVRAGLIPYVEEDGVGYGFLRDRSEKEEGSDSEDAYPVLAIRSTQNLTAQLAQALSAYCSSPYSYATPAGKPVEVNLPAILADFVGSSERMLQVDDEDRGETVAADTAHAVSEKPVSSAISLPPPLPGSEPLAPEAFYEALRNDAGLLARVLNAVSDRLPHELIVLVEQGEELFTIAQEPRSRSRTLDMLQRVAAGSGQFKMILSLRTEFFGRLLDRLGARTASEAGVRSFFLAGFDAEMIAEAIEMPTAREPVPYAADIPYEHYGFVYEAGLPEVIARDALKAAREGKGSALTLVQVVCAQLADLAGRRADRVIRDADLRALGGVENALERYAQALIREVSDAKADRKALRLLLQRLYGRQPDGTLVRDLVSEAEVANTWRGASPLDAVVDAAAEEEPRLLDVVSMPSRGEERRYVSLSNDGLAAVADQWAEEGQRWIYARKRVVDTLFIAVPCILLALVWSYNRHQLAASANRELEVQKKAAEALEQKETSSAAVQRAARWGTYLGNLSMARQAQETGNMLAFDQAMRGPQALLKDEGDLRGFEWYYLWRLGHPERATLSGHRGTVTGVAVTPDGSLIATASEDGTVKVWDGVSGLERATLTGHKGPVQAVAISGDGKLVASAGEDGLVKLWDAGTGKDAYVSTDKELATLQGQGPIRALAFGGDSKLASAGSEKKEMKEVGAIRLWDVKERKETKVLYGPQGAIDAVALTRDGKLLVSGGSDGAVILWDLVSGSKKMLEGHSGAVRAVVFAPDGKTLASGGAGKKGGVEIGVLKLWDVETAKERTSFTAAPAPVFAIAFAPDGKTLFAGTKDNIVQAWDIVGGKERPAFKGHVGGVTAIAVAGNGKTLVSGSYDRTAKVWDRDGKKTRDVLPAHDWVCATAFSPDSKLLASGGGEGIVKLWDTATGAELAVLKGHSGSVVALAFSPRGGLLAAGSWNEAKGTGELKLWDADPTSKSFGKEQRTLAAHPKGVTSVAFSHDGRTLASAGLDPNVILWDPISGDKKRDIAAHKDVVRSLAFGPESKVLATGGIDTLIRLWDPDTGKELPTNDPRAKGVTRVAALEGHTGPVLALAFSPDGLWLASGSADRSARLWDVGTGSSRATLRGHAGPVFSVAFSPNGETLATGGWDHSVKLWDPDRGTERFTFMGHSEPVRAVGFAPDRTTLASGSHDGTVRLWRAAAPERVLILPPHE
jgi:WD40 repeat protein